jgi:hypothetical protein
MLAPRAPSRKRPIAPNPAPSVHDGGIPDDDVQEMSSPVIASSGPGTPAPVFVDDSGRRRARMRVVVRIVVRIVVGILGLYVALASVSLVAPVSFPVVHLGSLGVLPRHRQNSTLGPRSKEAPLPAALVQPGAAPGGSKVPTTTGASPGASTPAGVIGPPAGSTTPSPATTIPTARTTTATATTVANTTTTTTPSTTTTRPHGPPTTGTHGPPTSKPGKGKP